MPRINDLALITYAADADTDEQEYSRAMQRTINDGSIWRMEGSAGRQAMAAIENGACLCAHVGCRDYWGNYVPARSDLKPGTKGTYDYVVERSGKEWADDMASQP